MLKIRDGLVELYKKVATSLPPDVEEALTQACKREEAGSAARVSLSAMLENVRVARTTARPLCQDTGVPVFYLKVPAGLSQQTLRQTIVEATRIATEKTPLRPNAVDVITETNSGDNTGRGFPVIHFEENKSGTLVIDLILKGGGCENTGQLYGLPLAEINAHRDLEGVRKCVIDTVQRAQGRGCPPYVLGIGIGASRDQVTSISKEQLLRRVNDVNKIPELARLEEVLLGDLNQMGIGPMGLGGKSTVMGVKIGAGHRHPASFFVDVCVSCWAMRRGRLIW